MDFSGNDDRRGRARKACCALALSLLASGCQGQIGDVASSGGGGPAARGTSGTGRSDATGAPQAANPSSGGVAAAPDVNRVAIHRLNNREYDNTIRDLLGVASKRGASFIEDEKLFGFDDIAEAFGMTDAQYEQYYDAADALVDQAFADAGLRGRIVTCTPSSSTDTACTRKVITDFGLRAWRRPLEAAEVDRLATLAGDAGATGADFNTSMATVVKAMLTSVPFLYRVELDPDPASKDPHPVAPYEMASRLSYLFWSTMPDAELLGAAASGRLGSTDALSAEVTRLLADAKISEFVGSFAGQWLGLRDLESHQVDTDVYPTWNDQLKESMVQEGVAYFREFLSGGRSMDEFFTADVNFVDAPLARLYGINGGGGSSMRVTNTSDSRRGFVGLASFLTMTSYSYRTAPTLRGKWVLSNLLCQDIPPPPPNVPKLDPATADPSSLESENVRVRLEQHRADPLCASCHKLLDPIGLGLENFDAIGKYRTVYTNGDAVDASGMLPDGTAFDGLGELTDALSKDARFADCVERKLLTYALSRDVVASDAAYVMSIREGWSKGGMGFAALLREIALSTPFRNRRGEPE